MYCRAANVGRLRSNNRGVFDGKTRHSAAEDRHVGQQRKTPTSTSRTETPPGILAVLTVGVEW